MSLSTLGGKLLRYGNSLALSLACCCRKFCVRKGWDECGNAFYECDSSPVNAIGPCTPACVQPPNPCECGPERPCPDCFECIDQKCERLPDCCADGSPCPPCQKCVDGTCVPCGPCEKCVDGVCVPCGPCEKCVDGVCAPCDAGEECVGGVCVPKRYYCCYESCPNQYDEYGDPLPEPDFACQNSPCGYGVDSNGDQCDLTKGGPYSTINSCEENCQKYKCVTDKCGVRRCVPDPEGEYDSLSLCRQNCPEDPCSQPPALEFSPGDCIANLPGSVTRYGIDACEREICVSYVSPNGRPIRVQIIKPVLDDDCNVIGTTVARDSEWRCSECCDCPNTPPRSNDARGECQGGPVGKLTWTKPAGVTWFCVHDLGACGGGATISVGVGDSCQQYTDDDWEPCSCNVGADCNTEEDCHCCCNKCQPEPCRQNCDDFANWTLEAKFCGQTLVWSADGQGNTGNVNAPSRLDYQAPNPCNGGALGSYSLCTGGAGGFGLQCFTITPELTLDESCFLESAGPPEPNPNAYKCVGHISLLATGPSKNCAYLFCVRTYSADIVDGQLVNVVHGGFDPNWVVPDLCECDSDQIEVTLTYNPLP